MSDPLGPGFRSGSVGGTTPAKRLDGAKAPKGTAVAAPVVVVAPAMPKVGTIEVKGKPGTFSYVTTVKIDAPPEKVMEALKGDWNKWWAGGKQSNQTSNPNGSAHFDLAPISIGGGKIEPINVHAEVSKERAEASPDGSFQTQMPVTLSGNFVGQAGFTLSKAADGGTYLQSTWKNMAPHGAAKAMGHKAIEAHFLAENNALKNLDNFLRGEPIKPLPMSAMLSLL
jgi:hypothetical protein